MPAILAVEDTRAAKLGRMAATYQTSDTCPPSCPLKFDPVDPSKPGPCFAKSGHVKIHWDRLDENPGDYLSPDRFLAWLKFLPRQTTIRYGIAGDQIPLNHSDDLIDRNYLELVSRLAKRRGHTLFSYTHYPLVPHNVTAIRMALSLGYALNISCDTIAQVIERKKLFPDLPRVLTVPASWARKVVTILGEKFIMCPNAWNKSITCDKCRICMDTERTEYTVVFPAHGKGKKQVDLIATDAMNV